jgi:hypothetical protein
MWAHGKTFVDRTRALTALGAGEYAPGGEGTMESVKFFCPTCRQKLEVEADTFGTKLQCPVCGAWMHAPNGAGAEAPGTDVAVASGKRDGPQFLLALGAGAVTGVALLSCGVAVAWWFGLLPNEKEPFDPNTMPQWSPQLASSALDAVSAPDAFREEAQSLTEKVPASVLTDAAEVATAPRRGGARGADVAAAGPPPAREADRGVRNETPQVSERAVPEAERRKIFAQLLAADDMSQQEARRQIPDDPTQGMERATSLAGQSREDLNARHVKQQRLQSDLLSQYQRAVENEHGITTDQARKILSEGIENQWDGTKRADITGE